VVFTWTQSYYFLPLSAHKEFLFQTVGECLEITALIVLNQSASGIAFEVPVTPKSRVVIGGWIALLLLILFWRDFFPNDKFNFWARSMDFLYAPLGGMGMMAIAYLLGTKHLKPSKEEEKYFV
jgi:hypothetical protein